MFINLCVNVTIVLLQNSNMVGWDLPFLRSFKVNFHVVIRSSFAVAAAVLQSHSEEFMTVNTLKLLPMNALMGEAHTALEHS